MYLLLRTTDRMTHSAKEAGEVNVPSPKWNMAGDIITILPDTHEFSLTERKLFAIIKVLNIPQEMIDGSNDEYIEYGIGFLKQDRAYKGLSETITVLAEKRENLTDLEILAQAGKDKLRNVKINTDGSYVYQRELWDMVRSRLYRFKKEDLAQKLPADQQSKVADMFDQTKTVSKENEVVIDWADLKGVLWNKKENNFFNELE